MEKFVDKIDQTVGLIKGDDGRKPEPEGEGDERQGSLCLKGKRKPALANGAGGGAPHRIPSLVKEMTLQAKPSKALFIEHPFGLTLRERQLRKEAH